MLNALKTIPYLPNRSFNWKEKGDNTDCREFKLNANQEKKKNRHFIELLE
jgi:hypothetical protein